jgi:hypothetical protein
MSQVKRAFNEYRSMPGGNPHDRPVLMKDGKVIDQDATVIEDNIIAESMRYISKMTKGLATGVMSQDEEYIKLQNKVINELIVEKSSETRSKIEVRAKETRRKYADAHKVHQKVLDEMYAKSAQLAKDNTISFYVNDENQVFKIASSTPIALSSSTGGRWRRIDLEELKKDMDARAAKRASDRKEREAAKEAEKKVSADKLNSMLKKKAKKTTKKKTVAKKKKVKAKKNGRK